MRQNKIEKITNTEYEQLISDTLSNENKKEKSIVEGKIIAIENNVAIVDVGLKSEGRIPMSEFSRPGQTNEIKIGETLQVFLENASNIILASRLENGLISASR